MSKTIQKKRLFNKKYRLSKKNEFDGSLLYGGSVFNKDTGRSKHMQVNRQKENFFVDRRTGKLKKKYQSMRTCIVCSSNKQKNIFTKAGFDFCKCIKCDFVFVNPVAKDQILNSYYQKEKSWSKLLDNKIQINIDKKKFSYGLMVIEHYKKTKSRNILDIGCASGLFLTQAMKCNWDAYGVELNKKHYITCRKQSIKVFNDTLDKCNFDDDFFDCVALWETLEHIVDPGPLIKKIYNILRPGGLLYICVPNVNSLISRILHEKSATFYGHSHVNFFDKTTLEKFINKFRFELLDMETIITELDNIINYLNYAEPYFSKSKNDLTFLAPKFIHDNLLGSRLCALFRK